MSPNSCWIIPDAPLDMKKREYLFYLLTMDGYRILPSCRRPDTWEKLPHLINIGMVGLDTYNYRRSHAALEDFSKTWPSYHVLHYEKFLAQLEEKLKINKNEENTESVNPVQDSHNQ